MSIPPGFATAVWPPSGIALAAILLFGYRYWPGVLLGSFMINVFIAFDVTSSEAIIKSSLIAGTIAAGAALQTLGSAMLVRRYVRFPRALESIRDIFILILLGGLAGCVINASISTSMLHFVGIIPQSDLGISWFTWWVGDSIGVIAFTHLFWCWYFPEDQTSALCESLLWVCLPYWCSYLLSTFIISSEYTKSNRSR